MDISEFFFMRNLHKNVAFSLSLFSDNEGKKLSINDWKNILLSNYENVSFPLIYEQDKETGDRLEDMISTSTGILYVISERFKNLLEENNVSGWKTYPVRIKNRNQIEIYGYYGFSVIGRAGKEEITKRERVIIEDTLFKDPVWYKGFYPGFSEWDGSDIFLCKDYLGVIVTKRVHDIIKKEKITGVSFETLSENMYSNRAMKNFLQKKNIIHPDFK